MKINKKNIQFIFIAIVLFVHSCGPKSVMHQYQFSARTDPFSNQSLSKFQTYKYSFEFGNNQDELIEKNILFHVGEYLNSIGWEYVEDNNVEAVLISIKYKISESDKKYTKRVKKGSEQVVVTGWDGTPKKDKDGNIKYKNKNIYGSEERTREGYLKEYTINLSYRGDLVWSIDISSFDRRHDIVKVSKRIIPKVLRKNFLKNGSKSGKYKFYIGCMNKNASNYCNKCEISDPEECEF